MKAIEGRKAHESQAIVPVVGQGRAGCGAWRLRVAHPGQRTIAGRHPIPRQQGPAAADAAVLRHTQPIIWAWDGTFDVGLDTGTSVDDSDYQVPFPFTGKLDKVTFELGDTLLTPEAIKAMMEELAKKRDR
jgi:hypothetical protein